MLTTGTILDAEEAYRKGTSLLQEGNYEEALPYLDLAADSFRKHDAKGHPAEHTLANGVSALANALYDLGLCWEMTGETSRAIACFETAYINERFEHAPRFRSFSKNIESHLVACYEKLAAASPPPDLSQVLSAPLQTDSTYHFPFSLPPEILPHARLFELAPARYEHLRTFYEDAKKQDSVQRRLGSKTDDQTMRNISIGVWSVIGAIWIAYGIVVIRTLLQSH